MSSVSSGESRRCRLSARSTRRTRIDPRIARACRFALIGGIAVLVSVAAFAADGVARLPRIGVLWPGAVDQWVQAFHSGLRENGYVDGATAVIDIRATGADVSSGRRMAEELIAAEPDVVFAVPGVLAKAIVDARKRAGKEIPMVFITVDPVGEGLLLGSAAHPGGNMTGIGAVAAPGDLMTKHLALLKEALPHLRRVGCLIDKSWKDFSLKTKSALERAGPEIGVRVRSIEVEGPDDLERALAEVMRGRAEAMIVPITPMFLSVRTRIIEFASEHRLPTAYGDEVFADEGGLMSYGFSVAEKYHSAAGAVAKILRGAKPGDIPVDYSLRFRFVVNLRTAKALGLRVPQSVLIQADELIK